jgi:hypothetical protein
VLEHPPTLAQAAGRPAPLLQKISVEEAAGGDEEQAGVGETDDIRALLRSLLVQLLGEQGQFEQPQEAYTRHQRLS